MKPQKTGELYDNIALWWQEQHRESSYGVEQINRAISYLKHGKKVLDVGCGSGGRIVSLLERKNLAITGIDVSKEMIFLASQTHPKHKFLHQDICTFELKENFDMVVAWDSIFHLPLKMQKPVLTKLCKHLSQDGILVYSLGDATGEHTDTWKGEEFYYSSLGINGNLNLLINNGLTILHMELDQYPEKHAYIIATKR